ncbi:MAG: hypothetical protein LKM32_13055 [Chiayiivirga sp.]|jgi:hypothetical protein|uniref:hypothetical protein n=1 Tax=Chiayiivirga sp. TaxID=2041042 RepID=UPI0025C4322A|nr:hypothetical protein [Chiayiivirga sp.]MCI1709447.1 hypothetical protein [Chiayiivirga sp.]MCI1730265.1 hypothetical protein [Chiayiivirga sp.]
MRSALAMAMWLLAGTVCAQALLPDDRIGPERDAAAGYAIGLDLAIHGLVRSCAAYGGDATALTARQREAWNQRNASLLAAAHRYLEFVRARIAVHDGEQAAAQWYESRKRELQDESQSALTQKFDRQPDAFATCRRVAASLHRGELDIATDAGHAAVLRAIALELPVDARE